MSRLALALVIIMCAPLAARGWGCEAHETIALLAEKHLSVQARQIVHDLLARLPVDSHKPRSCRPSTPNVVAEASTWADNVRRDNTSPFHGTGAWHFINIPRGVSSGDLTRFCPSRKSCVLRALDEQIAVLQTGRSDGRRADALRFIIHLIGDLHQPLHATTNNDRGGNCVPVTYMGIEPRRSPQHAEDDAYRPNLHAIWDTDIVRRVMGHRRPASFADVLEHRFQSQVMSWQGQGIDLDRWAWEIHEVAEKTAYGLLPKPIRVDPRRRAPNCERVSESMLALHERLTERYQNAVAPVVEEQLAKAGIRLAMVLNRIWP